MICQAEAAIADFTYLASLLKNVYILYRKPVGLIVSIYSDSANNLSLFYLINIYMQNSYDNKPLLREKLI